MKSFILLTILFIPLLLDVRALAASKPSKAKKCPSAFMNKVDLNRSFKVNSYPIHDARIIAEQLNFQNVKKHLMELTGKLDLDCNGCIEGRFTEDQKQRVRDYFVSTLSKVKSLEVEEHNYIQKIKLRSKPKSPSNQSHSIKPFPHFDLKDSKEILGYLENNYSLKGLKLYIEQVLKVSLEKMAEYIQSATIEDLRELRFVIGDSKSQYTEEVRRNIYSPVEGVEKIIDIVRYEARLKEEKRDQAKEKVKEEERYAELKVGNVVAFLEGTKYPERVIELTAHYDTTKENRPGADDNGSAVALLLEMARLFSIHKPEVSIRFVFNDLEERGMHGSAKHIENFHNQKSGEELIASIVVDTIAFAPAISDPVNKVKYVVEVGTETMQTDKDSFYQQRMFTELLLYQYSKYSDRTSSMAKAETTGALPDTTDVGNFWANGIPAVLIAAQFKDPYINPEYHKKGDSLELFNWGFYTEISQVLTETVALATKSKRGSLSSEVSHEYLEYLEQVHESPSAKQSRIEESKGFGTRVKGFFGGY